MANTITCANKEEAKRTGDNVGWNNIVDWSFTKDGKVIFTMEEGWCKNVSK